MNNNSSVLIDTSIIVAFYKQKDKHHQQVCNFFAESNSNLVTTIACVTEVMWLLFPNVRKQNEFLSALSNGIFLCENLLLSDYERIRELNLTYQPTFSRLFKTKNNIAEKRNQGTAKSNSVYA